MADRCSVDECPRAARPSGVECFTHSAAKGDGLPRFAWPGGYSIVYFEEDGEAVCATCVNDLSADEDSRLGLNIVSADIHWEGPPLYCANCAEEMPSEYGDPDADTGEAQ